MNIAVCDDNKLFLNEINEQLQKISLVGSVYLFSDLDKFWLSTENGNHYDAVLMDIEWAKTTAGMDASNKLYELSPETKIIYITGHAERFSQHIFLHRANLSGYLTKPVDKTLLTANLQKIADFMAVQKPPVLLVQKKGETVSIPTREIYYIESKGHIVHVRGVHATTTYYDKLDNVLRSLPAGFYQCHKSYIVNMSYIRRFEPGIIILKNDFKVPVSRAKYNQTKEAYFNYIGQGF